ncbi:HAD hydrolase family protein [Gardnerella sp. DNF00502]|uniref:HAD hydrolase family protein n=1 Tax=unclassified Gardnerella TaxID=2628112 RepID=UPI000C9FA8BE|nr:HAD hydrolase family protein [Gardnerella sp. KA00735]PNP89856.1 HAD family hydrolase [Gardnerella sp. KA00735]
MLMFGPSLIVADLDGTMLHDADAFENRFLTQQTIDAVSEVKRKTRVPFAIITARPVCAALNIIKSLNADVCAYLNGALIDFDANNSSESVLTSQNQSDSVVRFGFSSKRACEVCLSLLCAIPTLRIGIVMNDIRYTNFDLHTLWKSSNFIRTDFRDIPDGIADKIIIVPRDSEKLRLESALPEDFSLHISEDVLWMLTNPLANKGHALNVICERLSVKPSRTVVFGDDIIDIDMFRAGGYGVAVSNGNPRLLAIADEVCDSNNNDGVASWLQNELL